MMFRFIFKTFQQKVQKKIQTSQFSEGFLSDGMFKCFIHWYSAPNENLHIERKILEQLTNRFNVVLEIFKIQTQTGIFYNLIIVKGIENIDILPQFLIQALEVSKTTFMNKNFKIKAACIINKYGAFQTQKCQSVCQFCGEQQKLNLCCAKFICGKCSHQKDVINCNFCKKKLQILLIPLQTVVHCQIKYIHQPMIPDLKLEERFEILETIEQLLCYT